MLFSLRAHAEGVSDSIPGYDPAQIWNLIPSDVRTYLPSGMESYFAGESDTADVGDSGTFLAAIADMAKDVIKQNTRPMCILLGYLLILSAVSAMHGGLLGGEISPLINYISVLCLALTVYQMLAGVWEVLQETLRTLTVFVDSMIPVMGVLYAAGGNTATAAISGSGTALMISLLENICTLGLYPVLQICYGFTMLSGLCPDMHLSGLATMIRRVFSGILTAVMTVFSTVLSFQTVLSSSADTAGMRTVKYAAGNLIPIIGGAVSDAMQTLASGIGYIRTTVGVLALIVIALMLVPPLLTLFWYKIIFYFASVLCEVTGGEKSGAFIKQSGELLNFGIALLCGAGVMFLLVFVLFVRTAAAIS